jgi:hypothetical protein
VFPIGIPPRRTSDRPPLHSGHRESGLRSEPDLVTDHDVPPLGHDAIRAADITAGQVLEEVIAVEPAPSLPELGDPRPHSAGRSADSDGAGSR